MKWEYVTRSQATIGYLQNEKEIFRNLTISSILSENEPSLSKQISMSLSRKTIVEIYLEEILFFNFFWVTILQHIPPLYCTLQPEIPIDLLICSGKPVHAEMTFLWNSHEVS